MNAAQLQLLSPCDVACPQVIARVLSRDGGHPGQSGPRLSFESVRVLEDSNEITMHQASGIHAFLAATRGAQKPAAEGNSEANSHRDDPMH